MALPFHETAKEALPNLRADNYRITSAANWKYNCIAWAAGSDSAWWWPVPGRYWPPSAPREETLDAFLVAIGTLGFSVCATAELQAGLEKIALFAAEGIPTHAARQLSNGRWTSKLGPNIDIEHATLDAIAGGVYGAPVAFLSRPRVG
jgi:hypothetical protein